MYYQAKPHYWIPVGTTLDDHNQKSNWTPFPGTEKRDAMVSDQDDRRFWRPRDGSAIRYRRASNRNLKRLYKWFAARTSPLWMVENLPNLLEEMEERDLL